jgi:hypothetical protein
MRAIHNSGLLSFILVRTVRLSCIALSHLNKKLNNKLKVVISPLSEPKSITVPFYGDPLNSTRGCIQTVVTSAVVTKNVYMSRH